ncbi:MAG: hypothetical protein COB08_005210 [Rhodobacteraceae bacterium]|nr:hypothetical protein [Paracoccaceae bacterium]
MKQKRKHPKTATAFGIVAGALFIAGFFNFAFFFLAVFLGLIALILALGPDDTHIAYHDAHHPWNARYNYTK